MFYGHYNMFSKKHEASVLHSLVLVLYTVLCLWFFPRALLLLTQGYIYGPKVEKQTSHKTTEGTVSTILCNSRTNFYLFFSSVAIVYFFM